MKDQEIDRIATMIYEAPLGEYIGRDGARIFAERCAGEFHLKDGEFLYRKGDTTTSFHIVTRGQLVFVKEKANEQAEAIIHMLDKGDLVGELCFIDQTPHVLSARASGDVSLLRFDAKDINPLITEQPTLMFQFMRAIVKRSHHVASVIGEQESELRRYIATGGRGRS